MREERGRLQELDTRRWWLGALLAAVAALLLASAALALRGEARCAAAVVEAGNAAGAAAGSAAGTAAVETGPAGLCNGHACGARLDAVRFAGRDCGGHAPVGLEYCPADLRARAAFDAVCVPAELARGARAFLLEAHLRRGELRVCRDWCSVRPQRAEEVLRVFADFLRAHPREVLVLWFYPAGSAGSAGWGPSEAPAAGAGPSGAPAAGVAERAAVLRELGRAYRRTGLAAFSFRTTEQVWPTFGELVERNQRVVTLVDAGEASGGAVETGDAEHKSYVFTTGAPWDRRVGEGGAGIFAR